MEYEHIDAKTFRENLYRLYRRRATQEEIDAYIGAYGYDDGPPEWRAIRERNLAKVGELKAKYDLA